MTTGKDDSFFFGLLNSTDTETETRHCDGPATATITTSAVSTSATDESVGCEPHSDHWHCDGPASTISTIVATTTTHDHDDESESTGTLAPSPTESVGCEPHGDHWHCDGPAVISTSTVTTFASVSTSATTPVSTGGVDRVLINGAALAGGLALALL